MSYSTRLIFECDGEKYYYEIKNTRPDEICEKNPRAYINGLVNLKDVDTAKDLLTGRKIYVQSDMAQVTMPIVTPDIGKCLFRSTPKQPLPP